MLSKLPPERKAMIEQRLERYNKLPPEQREKLRREYDTFQRLSPENQEALRQEFRKFNNLRSDRHKPVRQELNRLRKMTPEKRERRLTSEAFKEKYSEQERRMLERMSGLMRPHSGDDEDEEDTASAK